MKALSRNPSDRYPDVVVVRDRLAHLYPCACIGGCPWFLILANEVIDQAQRSELITAVQELAVREQDPEACSYRASRR